MRRFTTLLMLILPLLTTQLLTSAAASACGTSTLEIGVLDLNDTPVAGVAFDLEVGAASQTATTDARGIAAVTCLSEQAVRIVSARGADGVALLMDENSTQGGLIIPLLVGQTQRVPLRLTDALLFVEPIAEPEQSAVFSLTPVTASVPTTQPLEQVREAAITPPIPTGSRRRWIWVVVALVLGILVTIGIFNWPRGARRGRRR